MQSMHIITNVVSSNPAHSEVYSIQHYVFKFVSKLRQVIDILQFPPQIKLIAIINEILLEVALNTITLQCIVYNAFSKLWHVCPHVVRIIWIESDSSRDVGIPTEVSEVGDVPFELVAYSMFHAL